MNDACTFNNPIVYEKNTKNYEKYFKNVPGGIFINFILEREKSCSDLATLVSKVPIFFKYCKY